MKLIILFCSILPIVSFNEKLCMNCKYFKNSFFRDNKFGKCSLFPKEETNKYHLVDGSPSIPETEYTYCSTARSYDDMCGTDGFYFVKK